MAQWIEELERRRPVFTPYEIPRAGEGLGLTDAMRGPLLHYIRVEGRRLSRYEIITPSAWNFSPRDNEGRPGPVEEALIGTPVADPTEPVEIGRIISSFDPRYACATHIIVRSS
ncbi:nickel-dependent hydrogenase large subunit [Thermodesulfitimonas sp.]